MGPGLRTLCLAYKDIKKSDAPADWDDAPAEPIETGLVCLGIVGIQVCRGCSLFQCTHI